MSDFIDSPYKNIPEVLKTQYTMNNSIPILDLWFNNATKTDDIIWEQKYVNSFLSRFTPANILKNKHGKEPYRNASSMLLKSFNKYNINNKKVAVVGSRKPWIEAILLNMNNTVTTVEYNVPKSNSQIICVDYFDFEKTKDMYDCIVTYSSIEHSGLGRYGDPLTPDGDLVTMEVCHNNLKDNGILILGVPIGHDALVWNAHRIYGKIRLPLLLKNFEEVEWIPDNKEKSINGKLNKYAGQPVIVLRKIDNTIN